MTNITGEQLYNRYVQKLLEIQDCTTDPWDQLEEEDKKVWDAVAKDMLQPY